MINKCVNKKIKIRRKERKGNFFLVKVSGKKEVYKSQIIYITLQSGQGHPTTSSNRFQHGSHPPQFVAQ